MGLRGFYGAGGVGGQLGGLYGAGLWGWGVSMGLGCGAGVSYGAVGVLLPPPLDRAGAPSHPYDMSLCWTQALAAKGAGQSVLVCGVTFWKSLI